MRQTRAQKKAYHRAYQARQRALARVGRPPTTRERVLATLGERGPLTMDQLMRAIGDGYERAMLYYHIRRLVDTGRVSAERVRGLDGAWYRYQLTCGA